MLVLSISNRQNNKGLETQFLQSVADTANRYDRLQQLDKVAVRNHLFLKHQQGGTTWSAKKYHQHSNKNPPQIQLNSFAIFPCSLAFRKSKSQAA